MSKQKPNLFDGNASISFYFTPDSTNDLKSRYKKVEAICSLLAEQIKNSSKVKIAITGMPLISLTTPVLARLVVILQKKSRKA